MSLLYGRRTGATRWNGLPHRQPRLARRALCRLRGGHLRKFGAYPSGSCVFCGWWPRG